MKWLADENVLEAIVDWLRSRGEDVTLSRDLETDGSDSAALSAAAEQGRIILTDDKDFGELVFRRRLVSAGVLLLRQHGTSPTARLERLDNVWPAIEANLPGSFVVVSPADVRVRSLPPDSQI